jgi:DNA topoisomerase I
MARSGKRHTRGHRARRLPGRAVSARLADDPPLPRGLRYVDDSGPGIRRVRKGHGFAYRIDGGGWLRDATELARIRKLAIPPAYTRVWICPRPDGHLQATGRDARGRKQYRYHEAWRRGRDDGKFERLAAFGQALPRIRARVATDLAAPLQSTASPDGRRTVLAALVRLLDTTFVRIGNPQYARDNGSYGLTTLRRKHAEIKPGAVRLRFRGKSGIDHDVQLDDPRVARILRRCRELPGQDLFTWLDAEGRPCPVGSAEVNDYIADVAGDAGPRFTAKDFRTWHGSVLALALANDHAEAPLGAPEIVRRVAERLRNTAAVCRKSYIHPKVLSLCAAQAGAAAAEASDLVLPERPRRAARGMSAAERHLLALLAGINRAGRSGSR